ncbi:lysophospholipid acyltransferase family protein [Kineococcus gynurae]|uniref:Lysophospholipid acyltransferase family protein n=1 Tax=Kineococcus gynurae TaxID=452979 RepID=A0ABV5LUD1_9ACTN
MLYWLIKLLVADPALKLVLRPWVRGLDHVPARGPAILASNHLSIIDAVVLPVVVPRRITFIAKAEFFTGRGVKGRFSAMFFRGIGQLPVDRTGGRAAEAALAGALAVLEDGELFGIYPEGTRSPDGRLYRGRTGVARIALRSGVPVLPVAMVGTEKVIPKHRVLPRIRRVGVVVGAPLDFSDRSAQADDETVVRAVTEEVMAAIRSLSGQEYVDEYAARAGVNQQLARRRGRDAPER